MNRFKEGWKESRKYYNRRYIIKYILYFYLRYLKRYLFHIWYRIAKYNHKHVWNSNFSCQVCRKYKRDIDYEKYHKKEKEFIHSRRFKKWKPPKFKHVTGDLYKTKWKWYVTCPENLKLGRNVDIGIFTYINARYGVKIGNNVKIGSHCSIYSDDTERNIKGDIEIANNTLIGSHVTILPMKSAG